MFEEKQNLFPGDFKLLQVCQFMYGGLHKVLTLPATALLAKPIM